MMNKRARKKKAKRIIRAASFALAVATFSAAIYITQLKEVNINYLGEDISFKTFASTVHGALSERDIVVEDSQELSTDLYGKLLKNNELTIREKPTILAMAEPVVNIINEIPVVKAIKKSTNVTSRGAVRSSWGPEVIKREEGVLEASDGTLIEYTGVMQLEATAYCACHECCGKWPGNKWYGITATGTRAKVGTIAVDPRVIPLGTKVYVEGLYGANNYGYATAEDTGGAIKGKIIDLYFNTHRETINWGRQQVKVYILKDTANSVIAKN